MFTFIPLRITSLRVLLVELHPPFFALTGPKTQTLSGLSARPTQSFTLMLAIASWIPMVITTSVRILRSGPPRPAKSVLLSQASTGLAWTAQTSTPLRPTKIVSFLFQPTIEAASLFTDGQRWPTKVRLTLSLPTQSTSSGPSSLMTKST